MTASLKDNINQLEIEKSKLETQVADLSTENRRLEDRLVREESHSSDLAGRLDQTRRLSQSERSTTANLGRGWDDNAPRRTTPANAKPRNASRSPRFRAHRTVGRQFGKTIPASFTHPRDAARGRALDGDLFPPIRSFEGQPQPLRRRPCALAAGRPVRMRRHRAVRPAWRTEPMRLAWCLALGAWSVRCDRSRASEGGVET